MALSTTSKRGFINRLAQAAVDYDRTLRLLPYIDLQKQCREMGIELLKINGEGHVRQNLLRYGNVLRPYDKCHTPEENSLGRTETRELELHTGVINYLENVQDYAHDRAYDSLTRRVDNRGKQSPYEVEILEGIARTLSEDIFLSLCSSSRAEGGVFDGFHTQILQEVKGGGISEEKHNLVTLRMDAQSIVIENAHPLLFEGDLHVYMGRTQYIRMAQKVTPMHGLPTQALLESLIAAGNAVRGRVHIHQSPIFEGMTIFAKAGILQLGVKDPKDEQFVQVIPQPDDPNSIRYWIQTSVGVRIASLSGRAFACSEYRAEGLPEAAGFSGDTQERRSNIVCAEGETAVATGADGEVVVPAIKEKFPNGYGEPDAHGRGADDPHYGEDA